MVALARGLGNPVLPLLLVFGVVVELFDPHPLFLQAHPREDIPSLGSADEKGQTNTEEGVGTTDRLPTFPCSWGMNIAQPPRRTRGTTSPVPNNTGSTTHVWSHKAAGMTTTALLRSILPSNPPLSMPSRSWRGRTLLRTCSLLVSRNTRAQTNGDKQDGKQQRRVYARGSANADWTRSNLRAATRRSEVSSSAIL